jgi:hypothetical protein
VTRALALPLALVPVLVLGCSGVQRNEGLDPASVPAALRDEHELFARRCSRCHSVSVPLLAHVSDGHHWVLYVERMRRQPNSGIALEEAPAIVRFLTWYTASQQPSAPDATVPVDVPSAAVPPPDAPPSTAPGASK